jgi:hypothetical protein
MSSVVSSGRVANRSLVHVSGAAAAPARRVAGLSPSAFFLPITHLRHFLYPHVRKKLKANPRTVRNTVRTLP